MSATDTKSTQDRPAPPTAAEIWRRLAELDQQASDLADKRHAGEITDEELQKELWSIAEEGARWRAQMLNTQGSRLASAFVAALLAGVAAGIRAYHATEDTTRED